MEGLRLGCLPVQKLLRLLDINYFVAVAQATVFFCLDSIRGERSVIRLETKNWKFFVDEFWLRQNSSVVVLNLIFWYLNLFGIWDLNFEIYNLAFRIYSDILKPNVKK